MKRVKVYTSRTNAHKQRINKKHIAVEQVKSKE